MEELIAFGIKHNYIIKDYEKYEWNTKIPMTDEEVKKMMEEEQAMAAEAEEEAQERVRKIFDV